MAKPRKMLEWLRGGIPLSLLMDLASTTGPDSVAISRSEANQAALARRQQRP